MAVPPTIQIRSRSTNVVLAAVIFAVAFLTRLGPMVRGGGLTGFTNYDDGVNFGGALGLVHGELPYRDFLWLHPPGIELALAPFAALSWLIGEPTAFVAARIGWMVVGAVNGLLVARLLRPAGWAGAVFGGLVYALFWPSIVAEQTVRLEAVATTCLLIALILLSSARTPTRASVIVLAGTLLGLAAAIKMLGRGAGDRPGRLAVVARRDPEGGIARGWSRGQLCRDLPAVLPRRPERDVADGRAQPA